MLAQFEVHLPLDEPVPAVLPDENDQRDPLPYPVSISWEFIRKAPSPAAASIFASSRTSLTPSAPGSAKAMVDSPFEIRQVLRS